MSPSFEFAGCVVVVTGGAKGIGKGISEAFLAAGATVVTCGRRPPDSLPVAGGREAEFVACDVRDPAAVDACFGSIVAKHGRFDVLINNAGGAPPHDAATVPARLAERIVQLNLLAPLYCAQAANRHMQPQGSGAIVNISSVAGARPAPGSAAYGAAKAGLLSLSRSLAMEWGPAVRVNAIIVGLMAADNLDDFYGGPAGVKRIDAMLPLGRMGKPQDIAAACLYLASPFAAYVSGATLEVHGGGERPVFQYLADNANRS